MNTDYLEDLLADAASIVAADLYPARCRTVIESLARTVIALHAELAQAPADAKAAVAEAVSEASIARALDAMEANMRRENQPTIAWRTEMPPEDQAKLRDCVRDGVRAALAQPITGDAS